MTASKLKSTGKEPIRGVIPPLVTPLLSRDELDVAGLERLLEFQIAGGVHGVFILGSTGETASLSHRLRRELIRHTCRIVAGRTPVLVGITDTIFVESINLAREAADAGAQTLVATSPYYFLIGRPELAGYFTRLTAEAPLPLMLYNIPKLTKVPLEPDTVRQMMDNERVVGIKDSSGDVDYLRQLLEMGRARADWSVLVGMENLLADAVRGGGHGGILGGGNFNPKLYVALYDAAVRGDAVREAELLQKLSLQADIHRTGTFVTHGIKCIKYALSVMGICGECLADPLSPLSAAEKERIQCLLKNQI